MSAPPGGGRLGEILVADAGLSQADLARGLALGRSEHVRLGSALVGLGLATADDVATALAKQKRVVAARDKHLDAITPETRGLVPVALARRLCAIAVGVVRGEPPELVVAMRDPDDQAAIADLAAATGHAIRPAAACEARLRELVDALADEPLIIAPTKPPPLIDLTPIPVSIGGPTLVPALQLEPLPSDGQDDDDDGPIGGTPSRPIIVDTSELELDGPARAPRPAPPVRPVVVAAPPIGGAALDDAPRGGFSIPPLLVKLLAVAILGAVALVVYDYVTDDDEPSGTAIHGAYHSARIGATMRLPGTGWREDGPDATGAQLPMVGEQTRADLFMRGGSASHPDEVAMIARITQHGAFANVDPAAFNNALEAIEQGSSRIGGGTFSLDGPLTCRASSVGSSPLGICDGKGRIMNGPYDLHFYLWMPTADDAFVAVWFDTGGGDAHALSLVRSIQVD